jgi:hypothetical protein
MTTAEGIILRHLLAVFGRPKTVSRTVIYEQDHHDGFARSIPALVHTWKFGIARANRVHKRLASVADLPGVKYAFWAGTGKYEDTLTFTCRE